MTAELDHARQLLAIFKGFAALYVGEVGVRGI